MKIENDMKLHIEVEERRKRRRKKMTFIFGSVGLLIIIGFGIVVLSLCKMSAKSDSDLEETLKTELTESEMNYCKKDQQYINDIYEAYPKEVGDNFVEQHKDDVDIFEEEPIMIELDDIPDEIPVEDGFKKLDILFTEDLQKLTYQLCKDYDVPYNVMLALIESETSFRKDIGNEKILGGYEGGDRYYGYCQLSEYNCNKAKEYALNAHTPEGNIEFAVILMSGLLEDYENDICNAVMAYKGGKNKADKWIASGYRLPSAVEVEERAGYFEDMLNYND